MRRALLMIGLVIPGIALALPDDAALTKLLLGTWHGHRHDNQYRADGTWVMDPPDDGTNSHGKWRIENNGLYFFRADGTWECRAADMIDGGRWKLGDGHTLDLTTEHWHSKATHEIIVIDRVVHETLYVRTRHAREVWLKQPGP